MTFERVDLGENVTLYRGDCLEVMPTLEVGSVDAVVTDPPYPDIEKSFMVTPISYLDNISCKQLVFWSAMEEFPLSYTAVHIWHKLNGRSSQHYERIFERNGGKICRVYTIPAINSEVSASMARDLYYNHPTQKPKALMKKLLIDNVHELSVIDPFMGSGTTGVACVQLGRKFIGIEIDPGYFEIAVKRIKQAQLQMRLPI